MSVDLKECLGFAIESKRRQLADALGWVQDMKDLGITDRQEIFNATNYVVILQDDLRKLNKEKEL